LRARPSSAQEYAIAPTRAGQEAARQHHARLETTRTYSRPTHEDRANALNLLDTDQ
jgi:hypothetical protein